MNPPYLIRLNERPDHPRAVSVVAGIPVDECPARPQPLVDHTAFVEDRDQLEDLVAFKMCGQIAWEACMGWACPKGIPGDSVRGVMVGVECLAIVAWHAGVQWGRANPETPVGTMPLEEICDDIPELEWRAVNRRLAALLSEQVPTQLDVEKVLNAVDEYTATAVANAVNDGDVVAEFVSGAHEVDRVEWAGRFASRLTPGARATLRAALAGCP